MSRLLTFACCLLWPLMLCAQEPAAAPDPDGPRATLQALAIAVETGNQQIIRDLLWSQTPEQTRFTAALAEIAGAMYELRQEALLAYGPEGARDLLGPSPLRSAEDLRRLENAPEIIEGDSARLELDLSGTINLRRVNGAWRLPVSELSPRTDASEFDRLTEEFTMQRDVYRQIAAEIAASKLPSAQSAIHALHTRLMKGMADRVDAAQRAATQPAAAK